MPHQVLWKLILLLFLCHHCNMLEVKRLNLGNKEVCTELKEGRRPIHWVSEEKSVLLVARGSNVDIVDCSVFIGGASVKSSFLRLDFESFYIEDCGVSLSVNQSSVSDFFMDEKKMIHLDCHSGTVGTLYTQQKHFVKVSIRKDDNKSDRYNFRISITVADSVPVTGLETHWLVIIGAVVLVVVGAALWLLVKYLIRRWNSWQELRRERIMEQAIQLYNSQETAPESDYMYTDVPCHDLAHAGENGHSNQAGTRPGRGDIAFVHADGHIETFRMTDTKSGRSSSATPPASHRDRGDGDRGVLLIQRGVGLVQASPRAANGSPVSGRGPGPGVAAAAGGARAAADASAVGTGHDGADGAAELPPSYEEALEMPTPCDPQSLLYVNLQADSQGKVQGENGKT